VSTTATTSGSTLRPKRGPHLVLMALYALFILASGSRAVVQIATQFDVAPFAYILSAVAAVTYVVGWFAIRRAAYGKPRLAEVMLWVELGGVVVIGTLSLVKRDWFPDASVWSDYGGGYGWVPAALPIAALLWLHRTHEKTPSEKEARA
jgi:RsiW-degrading membrane proteinase PrsW (M82 family)